MSESHLSEADLSYLGDAIELAGRGRGAVSPNPLVGAVLVRDGRVIGEGFHAALGDLHAERAAINDCLERGETPHDSTIYVSLEPCAHQGRQPPCADAILKSGIRRVVIASDDPSGKASGKGAAMLVEKGVRVAFADGPIADRARLQNQSFRKHARTGRPHVTLKSAVSLDGRVATVSGDSKWISGEESRALVHAWRSEVDAIGAGIGTVLADDPLLTARPADQAAPIRQPTRVVFDRSARLSPESQLVRTAGESPVVALVGPGAGAEEIADLEKAGIEVTRLETGSIAEGLSALGNRGITSLMLEGGPHLAGAFADAGEIDRICLFVAPILLGGGRSAVEGQGVERITDAIHARHLESEPIGEDILIRARVREW